MTPAQVILLCREGNAMMEAASRAQAPVREPERGSMAELEQLATLYQPRGR